MLDSATLGGLAFLLTALGLGTVRSADSRRAGRQILRALGLLSFAAGLFVAGFAVLATLRAG